MAAKEAQARIKINKLLEESGWRFFDDASGKANIVLEPNVKLTKIKCDALGDNFETSGQGFVDFLLLDTQGHPLVVLEAKAEDKNPLIGKEQARGYAKSQNCRFVILSNGNLHYFWDLEQGNPHIITRFPDPDSIIGYQRFQPDPQRLITEVVTKDYIALTQMPCYANEAGWKMKPNGLLSSPKTACGFCATIKNVPFKRYKMPWRKEKAVFYLRWRPASTSMTRISCIPRLSRNSSE